MYTKLLINVRFMKF